VSACRFSSRRRSKTSCRRRGEHPLHRMRDRPATLRESRAWLNHQLRFKHKHPQNKNMGGATSRPPQAADPKLAVAHDRGRGWGAGAVAPAPLCGRNRGLERPSNGWRWASHASPSTKSRNHTKGPGVEEVERMRAPAPRSRWWETTYRNNPHLQCPFATGTAWRTG